MPQTVTVKAPSRIHFGLMTFGGSARQFGGVGLMIDRPGLELTVSEANAFSVRGPLASRIEGFAWRWQAYHRLGDLPPCVVEATSVPREHTGLGLGTQLGMSLAAGLSAMVGLPQQSPTELAASVGRGQRSAVGAYGFVLGGLIAERGKLPGEPISPLDCHLQLPAAWRVLLVCPRDAAGLANDAEAQAFADLPPVPGAITDRLAQIARERMLPGAAQGDFRIFAEAVYDYGRLSGECFAASQGGPYNGPQLAAIVAALRKLEVAGVGQSSWGPTIFALLPDAVSAARLSERLAACEETKDCDLVVSEISRTGAVVSMR